MSNSRRTAADARSAFQSCRSPDPKDRVQFYDSWAETYEKDHGLASYRAPHLAVEFLSKNFCGSPEEALVLDVACGSGWVAKLMFELGFRNFVGVDGSKGMLEQAVKSSLYQDLRLALLGSQQLPAQTGTFDVVIIVGALRPGFVPVSIVRELCQAAKPGGYVCMTRVDPKSESGDRYKASMELELHLMEDEGLWTHVATEDMHHYMVDVYNNHNKEEQNEQYLNGTMYLYRKKEYRRYF
ncbi:methyltransferase-like protein 27 [Channa argus]|uniref:methyltransferase-like protein 27 n=1 Tax=Channa argus TaxID=215402 RepID=UPI002946FE72|nr:hypothetical protein Q8A73_007335 [Channa argus]